ncbi:hypothetical protein LP416_02090 [Polaromonas sp. P2-4]|nr:hypothetical protein LP416_02090 [Polaromonas sp. P2-4]
METECELKVLENEVLRKIGRNLMALQQVEGLLKTLLIHGSVRSGPAEAVQRQQVKRDQAIRKQTLGTLVGQFITEVFPFQDDAENDNEPEFQAPYFTFNYSIQSDCVYVQQRAAALKLVVDERNELVHHFLPKWTRASLESTQAADQHLDQQHARVRVEFETLRAYLEGLQRGRELLGNFISSPEYVRQMEELWLQGSRVVQLLVEMSRNAVSSEGWVRLDAAGQALWTNAEEDMSSLQAMYGYNKLKPLVVASQVFDVRDEPLSNGGSQVSFRIKRDAEQRPEN